MNSVYFWFSPVFSVCERKNNSKKIKIKIKNKKKKKNKKKEKKKTTKLVESAILSVIRTFYVR